MRQVELKSKDGTSLAGWEWPAPPAPKGTILLVHGFAEHAGRYAHVADALIAAGWTVRAFDFRGHGKSDGRRGHVDRWSDYHADLAAAVAGLTQEPPILLAHSMGGLVVLDAVLQGAASARALALTAPLLGVLVEVPLWKRWMAAGLSRVLPSVALPNDIPPALLSHDPAVVRAYESDPLVFKTATARWYREMTKAIRRVRGGAKGGHLDVFIAWGTDDRIVDPLALAAWCSTWGGKVEAVTPHGWYHEVLNERGPEVMGPLVAWLAGRSR